MTLLKTAVFIASRFHEFAELREHLRRKIADYPVVEFAPVDLNDGSVSHRPPLEKCLGFVRRSEFMILLVGDTYGSVAPSFSKSFTHLEYEEATRDGASTRVLVFMIGESYRERRIRYSANPAFAAWQNRLEARHTLGYLQPELSAEEKASRIFDQLLAALYEMRFGALSVDIDSEVGVDLFDSLSGETLDDSEVSALERRDAQLRGIELGDANDSMENPLLQPASVAAREQRLEASRAIALRDYGVAATHLKRAIEFKPLDMVANYWLAQLYVALGRKDRLSEAEELADRAARIASHDGLRIRAAAAYMLAARAALGAERREEGLRYASLAVEEAPWFARAHIELARQQTASELTEQAIDSIRDAYRYHADSLREVYGDPAFRHLRGRISSLVNEIKNKLRVDVEKLRSTSREMADLLGERVHFSSLADLSLPRLVEEGRRQVREQHRRVIDALTALAAAEQELGDLDLAGTPTNAESFRFKRESDAIHILCWAKRPGDEIRHGDVVFTFRFINGSQPQSFSWRRSPVRLLRSVKEDATVTTEQPWLFDHRPLHVQFPEKSSGQSLREQRQEIEALIESLGQQRNDCRNEMREVSQTIITEAAIAAALIVGGVVAVSLGWSWGVLGVAGFYYANEARKSRNARSTLFNRLDRISANEGNAEAERRQIILRLKTLQEAAIQANEAAGKALRLFERRALNQRAALVHFKTLAGASVGSLVRVTRDALERGASEHGRRICVTDPLPSLDETMEESAGCWQLFRVQKIDEQVVTLSRQNAYRRVCAA